jgi:hypothetical protein
MRDYHVNPTDIKTLIGTVIAAEYVQQAQERELSEASAENNEQLTCYFCSQVIEPNESINLHHPTYKSRGGTEVVPSHEQCHRVHHSEDFKEWGRLSALTRAWAWNLKNVRTHPAYHFDREYYLALYAH